MPTSNPPALYDASGVIHCHSTYSDGMEPVPVIMAAASRAGLEYLILTDHDTLHALEEHGEAWFGETLLLVGTEITPRHNHFLAYGVTETISPHLPPAEYTRAVAEQGGVGFIAHPYETGSPFLRQNEYGWEDWSVREFTGLELWNYFSQWVGSCRGFFSTLRSLLFWRRAVKAPFPQSLSLWDRLCQDRRVTAVGGMDAHGIKLRLGPLQLVLHPYLRSFRAVRTHLLLPHPFARDLAADRMLIMEALREGSCYLANHEEGDPRGFSFTGWQDGAWIRMGQEVRLTSNGQVHLSVRVPYTHSRKPVLRLIKDGAVLIETVDCDLQASDQGPGVYRVEVYKRGRGWIFSNPIYLRPAT